MYIEQEQFIEHLQLTESMDRAELVEEIELIYVKEMECRAGIEQTEQVEWI